MTERDPIRQLQHLLDDPGKVLERISRIQSALGSISTQSSTAPPETSATHPSAAEAAPNLEIDDQAYEGLLQMLREMQAQIEERVRPLAQRSIESEIDRVREMSERGQVALDECLAQIDQRLLGCLGEIHASRQSFTRLQALQRRLAELGAATEMVTLPADPTDLIASRLEQLRRSGKI